MLALGLLFIGGGVQYAVGGHTSDDYLVHYGPGPIAALALLLGPFMVLHSGFGLLTDLGVLPRIVIKAYEDGNVVFAPRSMLGGRGLRIGVGARVAIRADAKPRGGLLTPGYRVVTTLESDGSSLRLVVVTGAPDQALISLSEALSRVGVLPVRE